MKHLEGKVVYLIPTGNNARYNNKTKKATVIKVAKVFITIRFEGWDTESKLRYNGNELDGGYNSGYLLFETEDEIEDLKEISEISKKISSHYRYCSDYQKLSLSKLKQLVEILDLKTP